MIRHPLDKAESKYNPEYGLSKEDEDKYHKLLAENDELFKLIKMVSILGVINELRWFTNLYNTDVRASGLLPLNGSKRDLAS